MLLSLFLADRLDDRHLQSRRVLAVRARLLVVEGFDPELDHVPRAQAERVQCQVVLEQRAGLLRVGDRIVEDRLPSLLDMQVDPAQFKVGIARLNQQRDDGIGGSLQVANRFEQRDLGWQVGANRDAVDRRLRIGGTGCGLALDAVMLRVCCVGSQGEGPLRFEMPSVAGDGHRHIFTVRLGGLRIVEELHDRRLHWHVGVRGQRDFRSLPRIDLTTGLFGRFEFHVRRELKLHLVGGRGRRLLHRDVKLRRHRVARADDIRQVLQQALAVLAHEQTFETSLSLGVGSQFDRLILKLAVGRRVEQHDLLGNDTGQVREDLHAGASLHGGVARLDVEDLGAG